MTLFILTLFYFIFIYFIIVRGHKSAVEQSRISMKNKYEQLGEEGESARKLMQKAGYNV